MILRELSKKDKDEYLVPQNIFHGKDAHKIKFNKALETLPDECINHVYGIEVSHNLSDEDVKIPVSPKGDKITVSPGVTGTFALDEKFPLDSNTRMSCFYLDWDKKTNTWKSKPKVLDESLRKGISKFHTIMRALSLEQNNH